MKVILVGINHAGTSLIRTLKTLNPKVEVTAYDRNTDISFLGCGIALWVGGVFEKPDGLFYANKEVLVKDFGAKIFMQHDVIEINTAEQYVVIKDLKTGTTKRDQYDKLVYAGGTWPISVPVPGHDLNNIMFSKLYSHAQKIREQNLDPKVKNVVVIGAGYIGVELTEAFEQAGKNVTLVDMVDRVISNYFDGEFTAPLEKAMRAAKVKLALGEKLVEFKGKDGNVTHVVTDKNTHLADLVILAIGFRPNTALLKDQVEMLPNGAIVVNEHQQSSNPNVYAIGDSTALHHNIIGKANVALATNAVKTGVVAAFALAGNQDVVFPGVNGTNAISVFGAKYASTGVSEKAAQLFKIEHKAVHFVDKDKPEFMPNAEDVGIKLVYDPKTLLLLGAQIGSWGVENHTEVIYALSLAISKKMTLPEIALMDVFFLPHFNKPFNFVIKAVFKAIGLNY